MKLKMTLEPTASQAFLGSVLMAMTISWIDNRAPADFGIATLYYGPLIVSRWWGNRWTGLATALFCVFAEVYTNLMTGAYAGQHHAPSIFWWGITLHTVSYLGVAFHLTWVKSLISKERRARIAECAAKEELLEALRDVKELEGLLPICSWCKKIRDDSGFWVMVEGYIAKHSKAKFTHGVCPDCRRRLLEGLHVKETGKDTNGGIV